MPGPAEGSTIHGRPDPRRDRPAQGRAATPPPASGAHPHIDSRRGGTEPPHAPHTPAERHSRTVERQRQRARLARPDPPRQPGVRVERVQPGRAAPAAAEGRVQGAEEDARARRGARHLAGRRRRAGDEGVGAGARRHALHALVSAADGLHRGEARLLLRPRRRRHRDRRVLRQGADPGRARRLLLPHRRHPRHLRGARLHRVGPHLAGVPAGEPQRRAAVHPHGVHVVDRRGARPQDPAAALDGRALRRGDPRAASCSASTTRSACSRRSAPSRSTS